MGSQIGHCWPSHQAIHMESSLCTSFCCCDICQNYGIPVVQMKQSDFVTHSNHSYCFSFLEHVTVFYFGRFLNIIILSPGGASAHSYRQPKEAGSSALLRPRQNPRQQRSKHRLWAWGPEPVRWDQKYLTSTKGCVNQWCSTVLVLIKLPMHRSHLFLGLVKIVFIVLEGVWNWDITMHQPHNDGHILNTQLVQ